MEHAKFGKWSVGMVASKRIIALVLIALLAGAISRADAGKLRKEDGKLFVLYIMESESAREMTG